MDDLIFNVAAAPPPLRIERAVIDSYALDGDAGELVVRAASVSGWVITPEPVASITITRNDRVIATASYGEHRPDLAGRHPSWPQADQSGFSAAIRDLHFSIAERSSYALVIATIDGAVFRQAFDFEFNPEQRADPVGAAPAPPSMRIVLERAEIADGRHLYVAGWVLSVNDLICVQVMADGERLGLAETGFSRADVAAAWPDYPLADKAGFEFRAELSPDQAASINAVAVDAIASGGVTRWASVPVARTVGRRPPTPPPRPAPAPRPAPPAAEPEAPFHHHCDEIRLTREGSLQLSGWAVLPNGVSSIEVRLGEELLGHATIGLARPDVGSGYPDFLRAGQSGFEFAGEIGRPILDETQFRIVVSGLDGSQRAFLAAAVPSEAPALRPAPQAPPVRTGGEIRLEIDTPKIANGRAMETVREGLSIVGWALAQEGVERIEVEIDGEPAGVAHYGMGRLDVQSVFPDWKDSLRSGYALAIPSKLLANGVHEVSVVARAKDGGSASLGFTCEVDRLDVETGAAQIRRKTPFTETLTKRRVLQAAGYLPRFHVLIAADGAKDEPERLKRTLTSLRRQAYDGWTLLIRLPKGGQEAAYRELAQGGGLPAEKVRVGQGPDIARELASASLGAGEPRFVAVLASGDELGCDALLELAGANCGPAPSQFLFSDERRPDPATGRVRAFFKPGWSPELLLSTNYVGRFWCADLELLARAGVSADDLTSLGEHDLVLRLTEAAERVTHVPKVLCERGPPLRDTLKRQRSAIKQALARRGTPGTVIDGHAEGMFRPKRQVGRPGLVSIIIPTIAARGLIEGCIDSIRSLTRYPDYEIICLDNIWGRKLSKEQKRWKAWIRDNADQAVEIAEAFNWSRFNNIGSRHAKGEFLLFLNDDIEVKDPDWLEALLEHAQRPEVGVAGARLLYPDGKVQHGGMFLAASGQARHAFRFAVKDDPGYFGLALMQRDLIAVTGACQMVRREVFNALGGFDEAHEIVNNDLDFCLRAHEAGKSVVFTPHTELVHHELASRANLKDVYAKDSFDERWSRLFQIGDPFFNPNLSTDFDDFTIETEPVRVIFPSQPLADRASVRKILALKLDHIGDFLTAFPAVRRLRQHFPDAEITMLAAPASTSMAAYLPEVDEVLPFEFFNARSSLGLSGRTEEELKVLEDSLTARGFDLAIDLRKATETRHILRHTGATYLAGFDQKNLFPWLDFALEWDGDLLGVGKRQHVSADLVNLVDATAAAFDDSPKDRIGADVDLDPAFTKAFAALLDRDFASVHPAAGNELRQWPTGHFAALINMLIEEDGLNVAVLGGPDETAIAEEVLAGVRRRDRVWSLVGRSKLSQLPAIISRSVLFVGNNSGPSHVAGATGVPTVAVHSGVVSSEEWGPYGADALAVRKETSCGPCYRARVEECHRALACLTELSPRIVHDACSRMLQLGRARSIRVAPKLRLPRRASAVPAA